MGITIPLEAGYLRKNKKNVRFSMPPTRLSEAESNHLFFRANSATFNAPSTATVLGRDPETRRNAPTAPLLGPQPKCEKEPSAVGEQHA